MLLTAQELCLERSLKYGAVLNCRFLCCHSALDGLFLCIYFMYMQAASKHKTDKNAVVTEEEEKVDRRKVVPVFKICIGSNRLPYV